MAIPLTPRPVRPPADGPCVVVRAAEVCDLQEARAYYRNRLAGQVHDLKCRGQDVRVMFQEDDTHAYSRDIRKGELPAADMLVKRYLPRERIYETRVFDLERARHLDDVIPVLRNPALCVEAATGGRWKFDLYGYPLGRTRKRMHVVVRRGPGDLWVCVTAFPIAEDRYGSVRTRGCRFPP